MRIKNHGQKHAPLVFLFLFLSLLHHSTRTMDAHGHNPAQGYGYGYRNNSSHQAYNGYQSQRRTLADGSQPYMGNSFLPSLKRCVSTLEMSTQLVQEPCPLYNPCLDSLRIPNEAAHSLQKPQADKSSCLFLLFFFSCEPPCQLWTRRRADTRD